LENFLQRMSPSEKVLFMVIETLFWT